MMANVTPFPRFSLKGIAHSIEKRAEKENNTPGLPAQVLKYAEKEGVLFLPSAAAVQRTRHVRSSRGRCRRVKRRNPR